jgi:hypothetical protein
VCSTCRPKLTCCPTCRGQLGANIRNLAMEKVASTVMFPCRYQTSGEKAGDKCFIILMIILMIMLMIVLMIILMIIFSNFLSTEISETVPRFFLQVEALK